MPNPSLASRTMRHPCRIVPRTQRMRHPCRVLSGNYHVLRVSRFLGLSAVIPLLHVRGVAIGAHWTLIYMLIWVPVSLAFAMRSWFPELSTTTITALSLSSVFLLLGSVVLHELGHAFQARREGLVADRVILWGLGGVAFIAGLPRSAGADFRITAAGPLVTLLLAALSGTLAWLGDATGGAVAAEGTLNHRMDLGNTIGTGLYMVNVTIDGQLYTRRLVKQ